MIAIAEADDELASNEIKLLGRTAAMLGFDVKSKPATEREGGFAIAVPEID